MRCCRVRWAQGQCALGPGEWHTRCHPPTRNGPAIPAANENALWLTTGAAERAA
jgi:hypothetical protein